MPVVVTNWGDAILTSLANALNLLLTFIPKFIGILVLFLGTLAATVVADIVRGATVSANIGNPSIFAGIARWAIIGFAALVALEQLQIAPALINVLFTAIVGAAALAFGLAFGLGGRETAQHWLNRTENAASSAADRIDTQQMREQARSAAQL